MHMASQSVPRPSPSWSRGIPQQCPSSNTYLPDVYRASSLTLHPPSFLNLVRHHPTHLPTVPTLLALIHRPSPPSTLVPVPLELAFKKDPQSLHALCLAQSQSSNLKMGVEKQVIKEGDGTTFPKKHDEVSMEYTGSSRHCPDQKQKTYISCRLALRRRQGRLQGSSVSGFIRHDKATIQTRANGRFQVRFVGRPWESGHRDWCWSCHPW